MRFCHRIRRVVGRAIMWRVQGPWIAQTRVFAVRESAGPRTTAAAAAVALLLVCGTPLVSLETAGEVPFELYQRHLIVTRGSIGPLNGLRLLIDTGTIPTMVDRRIARKLHLRTEPSMLVAFGRTVAIHATTLHGFRIGTREAVSVPAGVGDLSYLRGVRVDAIVGLDVLARNSFSIDYRKRVLNFSRGPIAGESLAPLELVWPFVTVQMTVSGHPVRLLVDTGSSDVVLFKSRMPAFLSEAARSGEKIVHYASGPARLRRLELRQTHIGGRAWDSLPAWALDRSTDGYPPGIDGVLGVPALGCQEVRFDFERNVLSCRP